MAAVPPVHADGPFAAFLADLRALGVDRVDSGGIGYGMLGASSNERWWLVPMASKKTACAGLAMLQPITVRTRLAKTGAGVLLRCGVGGFALRKRLFLSGLPERLADVDPGMRSVAYFTGTAGPHRKTALQMMDANGRILGYAKLSRDPHVRPHLRNEAEMLERVARLRLRSTDIPAVLRHADLGGASLLVTDSARARCFRVPKRFDPPHHAFLRELALATGSKGAARVLDDLTALVVSVEAGLPALWRARFARGAEALRPVISDMPVCMAHGDFTPWNCFVQNARLYVFDWEYARQAYPMGYDFVHFHLSSPATRTTAFTPSDLAAKLSKFAFEGEERQARRAVLLSLLLHAAFYIERSVQAGGTGTDWEQCAFRGDLIDAALDRGGNWCNTL